jgi:uncharacterized protein YbaP (TraB family)
VSEPDELSVRSRRPVWIIAGIGAAVAIAAIVLTVLVVLGPTGDESPTAEERRALADEACPRVVAQHLYRVSKDGKTSYVLGTRHAGVPLAKFPAAVEQAFAGSTTLVVEGLLDDDRPKRQELHGTTIEEQLGDELWSRYEKLVGSEVAARVNHASPQVAAAALALLYEDASRSVDVELQQRARAAKIPIVALENADATDHLSEAYLGIDRLRTFVSQIPDRGVIRTYARLGLETYCSGRRDRRFDIAESTDPITDGRSRAWIEPLAARLADGGAFVAVGVQHVEGKVSILVLLEKRGFTFEAMP